MEKIIEYSKLQVNYINYTLNFFSKYPACLDELKTAITKHYKSIFQT